MMRLECGEYSLWYVVLNAMNLITYLSVLSVRLGEIVRDSLVARAHIVVKTSVLKSIGKLLVPCRVE